MGGGWGRFGVELRGGVGREGLVGWKSIIVFGV